MIKCDKCNNESKILLAYGPHNFCEKHFTEFFEDRVKKTIRKYELIKPKEKLLVALSGGKDSIVTLRLIHKFYNNRNEINALIIDEGVKGYREKAIKVAKDTCNKLKIPFKLVEFKKEFEITNDQIMPILLENKKLGGTCAFCGTLRRNIMNKYAKKLKFDKLITGHNLDDEVQSIVMNIFNNDFDRLKRIGASAGFIEHTGFVKRIKPLYQTPEKEIIAYCLFNGIKHYSDVCCPYSWTAKRNEYREMINTFENRFPGTEYSILRFYENLKPLLIPKKSEKNKLSKKLKECNICLEPTENEICKACEQIKKLKEFKNKKTKKKEIKSKLTCNTTKFHKIK
ncbi:MAG: TIGR00269 family protein [Candidatus ainarchaeum sp.]|nr:TIGR00269 family protein [Candidatus ainarchaeum sp.]